MNEETVERVLGYFTRRQHRFNQVFSRTNPAALEVLREILERCHNGQSCPHSDPIKIARWLGNQDVGNMIVRAINLSPEEQFDLARKKDTP